VLATFATQAGVASLSFLNVLIVARALGPAGRGTVALLTTVAFIASWLATLGADQGLGNLAALDAEGTGRLASTSLALAAVLGTGAGLIVMGAATLVPSLTGDAPLWLFLLVLLNVPQLVAQIFLRQVVIARGRFGLANAAMLVPALVNVSVNASLAAAGQLTVALALITWLAGQCLSTAALAISTARRDRLAAPDRGAAREAVSFGLRAYPAHVMNLGNYRADQWIMGVLSTPQELGLYSVAVAWSEALFMLPQALMTVQRPGLVRALPKDAGAQAAAWTRLALVLTLVLAGAMVVLAPFMCATIFGAEFSGSIDDLRVLALGGLGITALKMLGSALTAQGHPLRESRGVALSFVVLLGLDIALIPSLGGLGAAIASAVGYGVGGIALAVVFLGVFGLAPRELVPRLGDARRVVAIAAALRSRGGSEAP
jgi:O-antigen/teichoic acid export membrane protein